MPRGKQFRGISLALGVMALGLVQAIPASALSIGFTAQVLSLEGREPGVVPTYSFQGATPGTGFDHEVLLLEYDTSGAPYYVSKVTYTDVDSKFVPTAFSPGPPVQIAQPVTFASGSASPIGGSAAPVAPATIAGSGLGNTLTQTFAEGEFQQGVNNAELTYVQINNAAGEMKGVQYGNNLLSFQNALVSVTFTPLTGAPSSLTAFTLTGVFSIQTTPPYTTVAPSGRATLNFGSAGAQTQVTVPQQSVPEPGLLPTLLGAGVSGSLVFFRRRRPNLA